MGVQSLNGRHGTLQHNYVRRLTILTGIAGCLVCILLSAMYIRSHSRYRYTVRNDGKSGMRVEFTVSNRFKPEGQFNSSAHVAQSDGMVDFNTFSPKSGEGITAWVRRNILRHPVTTIVPNPAKIILLSQFWTPSKGDFMKLDRDGFITIDPAIMRGVASSEKLRISGEPATWTVLDIPQLNPGGHAQRLYVLILRPLGSKLAYFLEGVTESTHEPNEIQQEMLAIRDSVRIDPAGIPK